MKNKSESINKSQINSLLLKSPKTSELGWFLNTKWKEVICNPGYVFKGS